jgi:hypothetical protein
MKSLEAWDWFPGSECLPQAPGRTAPRDPRSSARLHKLLGFPNSELDARRRLPRPVLPVPGLAAALPKRDLRHLVPALSFYSLSKVQPQKLRRRLTLKHLGS